MEVQLVQRSWGQIQCRIAFTPDSRPFRCWWPGMLLLLGWNGWSLLLLPGLALREAKGDQEKERGKKEKKTELTNC